MAHYKLEVIPNEERPTFITKELQATIMSLYGRGLGQGPIYSHVQSLHIDRYLQMSKEWYLVARRRQSQTIFTAQQQGLKFGRYDDASMYGGKLPINVKLIPVVFVQSLETAFPLAQRFMSFPHDTTGVVSTDATFETARKVAVHATHENPIKNDGITHCTLITDAIGCVKSFVVGGSERASRPTCMRQLGELKAAYVANDQSIKVVAVGK